MATTNPALQKIRALSLTLLLVGILAAISAVAMFSIAAYCYGNAVEARDTWSRATGTVVRLDESPASDDSGPYYHTVFSFVPEGRGEATVVRCSSGSRPAPHQVGDVIDVLYPADHPADARENSDSELFLFPRVLGALGVVEALLAAVMLGGGIFLRRRKH